MKLWSLGRGHVVSHGAGTFSPNGCGRRRLHHGRKRGDPIREGGGGRLLQGLVKVCSRLWDGEIEIATIPDYYAYLRAMLWVDVFDVRDPVAVRPGTRKSERKGDNYVCTTIRLRCCRS